MLTSNIWKKQVITLFVYHDTDFVFLFFKKVLYFLLCAFLNFPVTHITFIIKIMIKFLITHHKTLDYYIFYKIYNFPIEFTLAYLGE